MYVVFFLNIWTVCFFFEIKCCRKLCEQEYQRGATGMFQDNQSTIALANKGFSTSEKTSLE